MTMGAPEPNQTALEQIRNSRVDFRTILDEMPALAWSGLPDGSVDFANRRWLNYTGLSSEALHGWGWKAAIYPEDLPDLVTKWDPVGDSDNPRECEVRLRRFDGVFRWFLFRREPLRDESHSVIRWYGTAIDIHDAKQIQTLRDAENRILQMIANGTNLSEVLNGLCAAIDEHASATSFVCLMDGGGKQLLPIVGPHIPPTFATAITPWPIGPNRGSCGTAAFTKSRVIIPDISNDPPWPDELRNLALGHGFRAAWSEPLISKDGEVLGTFCISYPQRRTPGRREVHVNSIRLG